MRSIKPTCVPLLVLVSLGLVAAAQGDDSAKDPDTKAQTDNSKAPPELLKDVIDPFDSGRERARFLKAAGVDSELDTEEFRKDVARDTPVFVRSFEQRKMMVRFDKNGDGKFDWFEMNSYRQALRKAVLATYDADGNQRLTGAERDNANAALAKGKLPSLDAVRNAGPGDNNVQPGQKEPGVRLTPQEKRERAKGFIEKQMERDVNDAKGYVKEVDTNGDGVLDDAEIAAELDEEDDFRARYLLKVWPSAIKMFDANRNGKIDESEYDQMLDTNKQFVDTMLGWDTKINDMDGDSLVSDTERQQMGQRFAMIGATMAPKVMTWADRNGDGRVEAGEWKDLAERGLNAWVKNVGKWTDQADSDGDGRLGEAERTQWRRSFEGYLNKRYSRFDDDGDGKLNNDQFVSMLESLAREYDIAPKPENKGPNRRSN